MTTFSLYVHRPEWRGQLQHQGKIMEVLPVKETKCDLDDFFAAPNFAEKAKKCGLDEHFILARRVDQEVELFEFQDEEVGHMKTTRAQIGRAHV